MIILHKYNQSIIICSPISRDFSTLDTAILNREAFLAVLIDRHWLK